MHRLPQTLAFTESHSRRLYRAHGKPDTSELGYIGRAVVIVGDVHLAVVAAPFFLKKKKNIHHLSI